MRAKSTDISRYALAEARRRLLTTYSTDEEYPYPTDNISGLYRCAVRCGVCRLGYALRYVLYRQREKNGAAVAPGHGTTSPGIGMLTASCVHSFHFLLLCNCLYGGQLPFSSMSRIVLFNYITFRAFCQCFFALPLSVGACAALLPMHLYRWLQL